MDELTVNEVIAFIFENERNAARRAALVRVVMVLEGRADDADRELKDLREYQCEFLECLASWRRVIDAAKAVLEAVPAGWRREKLSGKLSVALDDLETQVLLLEDFPHED